MSYVKATPAMLDRAAALWAQGISTRALAKALGISPSTLNAWKTADPALFPARVSVDLGPRTAAMAAMWNEGHSAETIGQDHGVSGSRVRQLAMRFPDLFEHRPSGPQRGLRKIASDDCLAAARLWGEDVSAPAIAERLGVKISTIYKWAKTRRELFAARPLGGNRMSAKADWTEAEHEALKALAGTMPARAIAAKMGKSRSAVLGKMFRLGLKFPERSSRAQAALGALQPKGAAKGGMAELPKVAHQGAAQLTGGNFQLSGCDGLAGKALEDLGWRDCRWPVNAPNSVMTPKRRFRLVDGAQHLFCGGPAVEGKSYCAAHLPFACVSADENARQHKRIAATLVGAARRNGEKVSGGGKGMKWSGRDEVRP